MLLTRATPPPRRAQAPAQPAGAQTLWRRSGHLGAGPGGALRGLPRGPGHAESPRPDDPTALRNSLNARERLRERYFAPEEHEALFARESALDPLHPGPPGNPAQHRAHRRRKSPRTQRRRGRTAARAAGRPRPCRAHLGAAVQTQDFEARGVDDRTRYQLRSATPAPTPHRPWRAWTRKSAPGTKSWTTTPLPRPRPMTPARCRHCAKGCSPPGTTAAGSGLGAAAITALTLHNRKTLRAALIARNIHAFAQTICAQNAEIVTNGAPTVRDIHQFFETP